MTGRIQENAKGPRLWLHGARTPAGRDDLGLLGVQILCHEVQMALLRYSWIRPGRRAVVQIPLEAEAERGKPQLCEGLRCDRQLASGHPLVELRERHRIRAVQGGSPERCRHGSIGRRIRRIRLLSAN